MKVASYSCRGGAHLFVLLVQLVIIPLEMVKSDHTTLCIALPNIRYRDKNIKTMGMEKFPQNKQFWKRFQERIVAGRIDESDLGTQRNTISTTHGIPKAGLRIYRIKDTRTQRDLNGWFRVEFWASFSTKNPDLHDGLKLLLIHVEDDYNRRQSIGEFSLNFPTATNSCPQNDATKYMILSCGGASRAEPLVSNVILFVRNSSKDKAEGIEFPPESDGLEIVPNLVGRHSLNFYIRIPVQDCNQHHYYVVRAKMLIDKSSIYAGDGHSASMLKEDWYRITSTYVTINKDGGYIPGASDALPSRSGSKHLDCNAKLSSSEKPWYTSQSHYFYTEDAGQGPYNHLHLHGCQGQFFRGRCYHSYFSFVPAHGLKGVRTLSNQNVAEENQIPLCDTYATHKQVFPDSGIASPFYYAPKQYNNVKADFPFTHDYLHKFASSCNTTYNGDPSCTISKVVIDVKRRRLLEMQGNSVHLRRLKMRLLNFNDYHPFYFACVIEETNKTKYSGNNCSEVRDRVTGLGFHTKGYHRLIWGMRKGHALLMAIAMLFVLPINLFVTRYFKESFMTKRILYSRVWYQVHVHGTFFLCVFMFGAVGIIYISKFYVGESLTDEAIAHRVLGWITIILFVLLTVLGGFRGYEDPLRRITIILHWAFGIVFYVLMVIEMATGVLIPGSGVTSNDPSICDYDRLEDTCVEQKPVIASGAFVHVFVWVFIEIIMHIIMMSFIMISDKQMAIVKSRIFFPVLIPVIREKSKVNAFGHSIRVILLCVYVFLALCSTSMYIIAYIEHTHSAGKGLGPMKATHTKNSEGQFEMLETLGDV